MTMTKEPKDKLAHAKEQGQAQFDNIVEVVEALNTARELEGTNENYDAYEHALSVEVRGGWVDPSYRYSKYREVSATEYRILLCTGGPAVRIIGQLSKHFEPETAHLEVQDWGTPWTEFRPQAAIGRGYTADVKCAEETLLTFARCFWFGE